MPYCMFSVKAELNRAIVKAQETDNYDETNKEKLKIDLVNIFEKNRFAENIYVRIHHDLGYIRVHYKEQNVYVPLDSNLILCSDNSPLVNGLAYTANSNGKLIKL